MKEYKVTYSGNATRFKNFEVSVWANSEREAVENAYSQVLDSSYFPQEDGSIKDCDGEIIARPTDETIEYDGGCFSAEEIKEKYLCNAFSLQMLQDFPCNIEIEEIKELPSNLTSAVGHLDTANVLGVPCNRINVSVTKGDVLYVAQLQGGRLPEGSTTLPEGFNFKFLKITIL
jgi:hypothetical protein